MRRTWIAAIGLIVVVSGCGSPGPTDGTRMRPAVVTSGAPPTTGRVELTEGIEPLVAGTYARTGFRPPITFAVGDGWYAGTLSDGLVEIGKTPDDADAVAVQLALIRSAFGADGTSSEVASAEAVAELLRSNPGLTVIEESASSVGGLDGLNVTIEHKGGQPSPLFEVADGTLSIDPGERRWISLFDTPDGVLAIMVAESVAGWDRALTEAEPVLESIVVGS